MTCGVCDEPVSGGDGVWCEPCRVRIRAMARATERDVYDVMRELQAARRTQADAMPPHEPEPLTIAEVERIATNAAHEVNPAIRVTVDSGNPFWNRGGMTVWLSLAGKEFAVSITPKVDPESLADMARCHARELCEEIGKAWRPEGWREP